MLKTDGNSAHTSGSTQILSIEKIEGNLRTEWDDALAVEEPLEIRLDWSADGKRRQKSISITMRTPSHDFELAAGFLFTEGIIKNRDEILEINYCGPVLARQGHSNIVKLRLADSTAVNLESLERHFYTSSSCGVCGKSSIEALKTQSLYQDQPAASWQVEASVIHALPDALRSAQAIFESTGGLHASALFNTDGQLLLLREDVGRHNALDKVIGAALLDRSLPLAAHILMVSGRVSFELVQKASMAGLSMIIAVGAPSSLAVELARETRMCLLGFVRQQRFNIYTFPERIR